jgi:hypothetical protein
VTDDRTTFRPDDDIWALLDGVVVRFWSCPIEHPREPLRVTVEWDGDVATCTDCGMTNLTDPRLNNGS